MNYDVAYKESIDILVNLIKSKTAYSKKQVSILKPLYTEIVDGLSFAKKQFDDKNVRMSILKGRYMHVPPSSRFMPREINQYISNHMKRQVVYIAHLGHRKITIRFGLFNNKHEMSDLEHYAQIIISWIYTIVRYADYSCGKTQLVDIYFTDYKKKFPKSSVITLSPINCNSGFSTVCAERNEITIFRSEEWFKVFLHESFHSFGLEPNHSCEMQLSNYIADTLPIKPMVRVSETYVEVWARIINVVYSAVINSKGVDEFYDLLRFSLQLEVLFSVYQAVRVLNFMNLDYRSLIDKTSVTAKMLYKEDTHVFAYYILSAAFMNNSLGFISWCDNHNTKWLKFYNSNRTCNLFKRFMYNCIHDPNMLRLCDIFKSQECVKQGLRFSIVETLI